MKTNWIGLLVVCGVATSISAAPIEFDFKDPKGVNNAVFKLDAPLESINGSASGVSGTVKYDPENPSALEGKILVDAATLQVGNPMMKQHMLSDKWLNTAKYPEICFEATGVKNVKTADNVTTADVTGKMTIKGKTKELTVPVKLTFLKDKLKDRFPAKEGDLLVMRSEFTIKRADFDINPGQFEDKVANTIALTLSIAGMAAK